jgi:hypothetical protein
MKLSNKDIAIQFGIKNDKTVDRFISKLINKPNGCIEYKGAMWDKRDRYRAFSVTIKESPKDTKGIYIKVKAHRFAYALHYGFDSLPKAGDLFTGKTKVINHICNNPKCVNPKHLNVMTSSENLSLIGVDQEV